MYKNIFIFFLAWLTTLPFTCLAQTKQSVDSLLLCIDKAIDNPAPYINKKEQRIGQLRHNLQRAKSLDEQYLASFLLYEEYTPFINDSAIYFLDHCINLGIKARQPSWVSKCQIHKALRCSSTGLLVEALTILKGIDTATVDASSLGTYYQAYAHACGEIAYYTHIDTTKKYYEQEAYKYRQFMYAHLPKTDNSTFQYRQLDALNANNDKEAMRINNEWLKHTDKDSHAYALVTLYRYLSFKMENDTTKMMYWLAESVLSDIEQGVMDQGSMWEMANQLMAINDVDRAYRYISYTCTCTGRFGSRQRLAQIAPLLDDIAKKYKEENDQYNQRQTFILLVISLLAMLLLFTVFYISKKRHQLAIAKNNLALSNSQLSELNKQLKSLNEQQAATNAKLSSVNKELTDANRVKEEYVGRFMRLCSLYVNKLETLRKKVNKKVKTKQYAELYEMTRPQDFKEEELEEFYTNFDSAFLHLFPNFIESFNALLKPEDRLELPEKEHLSTPIRIFALIRLGINDSSKIAEFLHYSVNTIYNYRAQIKKGAISSRDTFEEDVKKIGKF